MSDAGRYEGRPFLRLLDCYVMRTIGQLDEAQDESLQAIEPQLAQLYGKPSPWYQVVMDQMEFTEDMEANIRQVWIAALTKADELNMEIDPAEFTRQFVDTNFM